MDQANQKMQGGARAREQNEPNPVIGGIQEVLRSKNPTSLRNVPGHLLSPFQS